MTEKQLRARTSLLKAMLLVSALLMGYSDLITTNEILQRGMGELNPFMRFTQEWLGEWWLIAKLGLTYLVMWMLWRGKSERQMACGRLHCDARVQQSDHSRGLQLS